MSARWCGLFLSFALSFAGGCTVEPEAGRHFFPVSGRVTYRGEPVGRGVIHLVPREPEGITASGEIVDGSIVNVTSRTPGDGAMPGDYRVSISIMDEAGPADAKGTTAGRTPGSYVDLMSRRSPTIPLRYSSIRDSGLTAEISTGKNELVYRLEAEEAGPRGADDGRLEMPRGISRN